MTPRTQRTQRSADSKSLNSSNVSDRAFMHGLTQKSRHAILRKLNAEVARGDLITRLERKQQRTSSVASSQTEDMPSTKQQLLTRYEEKLRQIRENKAITARAEKTKAKEWRRLLKLEAQTTENWLENHKHMHRLREVMTAREHRRFRSWREQVEAEEIETLEYRRQSLEAKMSTHNSRYLKAIKKLSEKTSEKLKRVSQVASAQAQQRQVKTEDLFRRYIEKQSRSQSKRQQISSRQAARRDEKQKELNDKLAKVKDKAKETLRQVQVKAQDLEAKAEASDKLLYKKATEWKKELDLRVETRRLKTNDSKDISLRNKRIAEAKREQILQRHLEDQQRIESLLQARRNSGLHKRDLGIKAMIERERLQETLTHIQKIPSASRSKKSLMRRYGDLDSVSLNSSML